MTNKLEKNKRNLLKSLAAGGSIVTTALVLPEKWISPVVESVLLPAHATATPTKCLSCGSATTIQTDSDECEDGTDEKIRAVFDPATGCSVETQQGGESTPNTILRTDSDSSCDGTTWDTESIGSNWDRISQNFTEGQANNPSGNYYTIVKRIAGGNVGRVFRMDFKMTVTVVDITVTQMMSEVEICEIID